MASEAHIKVIGDQFLREFVAQERGEGQVSRKSTYVRAEFAEGCCVGAASSGGYKGVLFEIKK
jgi:hypothetical protein